MCPNPKPSKTQVGPTAINELFPRPRPQIMSPKIPPHCPEAPVSCLTGAQGGVGGVNIKTIVGYTCGSKGDNMKGSAEGILTRILIFRLYSCYVFGGPCFGETLKPSALNAKTLKPLNPSNPEPEL